MWQVALRKGLSRAFRGLRERQRRTWAGPERLWVELREVQNGDADAVVAEITRRVEQEQGVLWARYNARWERLVVQFDPAVTTAGALLDRIDLLEDELGFGYHPLSCNPQRHPADTEPTRRAVAEAGLHAASLVAGLSLRLSNARVRSRAIDLAAITTALRGVPRLRESVDRQLGPRTAELVLEAADALTRALMQGATGAAVDLAQHGLEIRERRARARSWEAWEHRIGGQPHAHPRRIVIKEERAAEIPPGPVERYVDRAVLASLGAFAFGLAATGDAEVATAPLFGGIPKPARVGRSAFVRQLALRFTRAGVLVQRAEALEVLDRVGVVVIEASLVEDPRFEPSLSLARAHGITVIALGERPEGACPIDQAVPARMLRTTIRRHHAEGEVVAMIAASDHPGFALCDVGLGLFREGAPVPWAADLVSGEDGLPRALALLVGGCIVARDAARHAVWLAGAEAITAMVMALGGVKRQALRYILEASNIASLVSLADAVRLASSIEEELPGAVAAAPPWHQMSVDEVLAELDARAEGLDADEAARRRAPHRREPRRAGRIARSVLHELENPLTPVLAGGAGLSALVGSAFDAGMVASVIGLNAVVGGVQRYRTERALERLVRPEDTRVIVQREGRRHAVRPTELVEGDVVCLQPGEVVPADCRILDAEALEVDEASLTGESMPVAKSAEPCEGRTAADRSNMLYEGTTIAAGRVRAVVVATGAATEVNRAMRLQRRGPKPGVEARLESLTELTVPLASAAGLALIGSGVLRRRAPEELVSEAVGLAVAAVPEGLPLLATVAQLSAAQRLGERGALVRHPRAVEALGRMQVLCADKTGTLTEGRIRFGAVWFDDEIAELPDLPEEARKIVGIALRASPRPDGARMAHLTDRAVVDGATELGVTEETAGGRWERVEEMSFDPMRSFSATLGRRDGRWTLAVKGAPEAIVERCSSRRVQGGTEPLTEADRAELVEQAARLARRGYRVLAVAERIGGRRPPLEPEKLDGFTFHGFVGLSDPVRPTAREAVAELRRAGVEVRLLTGDHPQTALAVAEQLGLTCGEGDVLTGDELETLDEAELAERVARVCVYARVTPAHKVRIVRALQRTGLAVGMTGDGANDAPAIQLADVGIALGEHATAAARGAADLVVADGRIETIVEAVVEGRKLWISVRDAVSVLVGGNVGEIGYTVLGGLLTGRPTLNTRQLLLVNLFTDAVPAMVIAMMPPSGVSSDRLLEEGPDRSLDERLTREILWRATVTTGSGSLGWVLARLGAGSRRCADTVGLVSLVGAQLGQTVVLGRRSPLVLAASGLSMVALLAVVEIPGLSGFFGCRPLGPIALGEAAVSITLGTAVSAVVPVAVREFGPPLRAWARRERLREQEWVRLVVESRAASRLQRHVERWRSFVSGEEEPAVANQPLHDGDRAGP